ncbi:DNA polymerase III subunit delta' [Patescibacteria group bacterium]|nr:DNA polymerase III subunit delta' [Patescibacteria group bacterium]
MEVIGHQKVIQFLQKSIVNNKLSHAYLFYGPKHVGKTKVAEYFTASLFCPEKKELSSQPCGQCSSCQQVLKRIHPDVYWVSDPPNSAVKQRRIGIDQARQIKKDLFLSPFSAPYKIAIIEQADNLTIQAANSFLKLLEEAPKKSIIILIARSFYRLPATLRSRCQILRFSFPLEDEIIAFLKDKFALNKKRATEILNLALGQPGLAIEFAQEPERIDKEKQTISRFITFLAGEGIEDRFRLANFILDSEIGPNRALNNLLKVVRDLILFKLDLQPSDESLNREFKKLVQKYSKKDLQNLISQILQTQFWLLANVNQKLAIENLLINQ